MALVTSIERSDREARRTQKPVRCLSSIVQGNGGVNYVQLITLGTNNRQEVNATSQTIRFDRHAAGQLIDLLREAFPDLV